MIQGCIIFYNDTPELLINALMSLRKVTDYIVGIDGAFKDFPHDKSYSTDGCLDVAKKFCDKVIEGKEWPTQIDKRNAYLTLDNENDFYFILDADEMTKGYISKTLDRDYYAIDIHNMLSGDNEKYIRLFRHKKGLQYKEKHAWVWHKGKIINHIEYNSDYVNLDTIRIIHNPQLRSNKRLNQDSEYMKKRNEPNSADIPEETEISKLRIVRLKYFGKYYDGSDEFSETVKCSKGEEIWTTHKKMVQLLMDFPDEWAVVEYKGVLPKEYKAWLLTH